MKNKRELFNSKWEKVAICICLALIAISILVFGANYLKKRDTNSGEKIVTNLKAELNK